MLIVPFPYPCTKSGHFVILRGGIALLMAAFSIVISGCGNSSTSAGPSSPPVPDFSFTTTPSTLNLNVGGTSTFTVVSSALNGFSGSVAVSLTGLPAGVTASPATISLPSSGSQIVTLTAAASAALASSIPVSVQATSGSITHTVNLAITIARASGNRPVALKSRTRYVRTDAATPYSSYPPPNWTIYHSPTGRFFASDPTGNRINVFDSATRSLIASIIVPGAFGMDQAPDGSVIYVGTESGDLYLVDPVKLVVTRRYPSDTISPYGFSANAVYALANGKLLLQRYLLLPGYSWVDGNGPLALWNPADNSIVEFNDPNSVLNIPPENTCLAGFEYGILTNNRSRILLTPTLTSQGSSLLCSLDPNSDTWVLSPVMSDSGVSALATLAVSSDGTTVAAFNGVKLYVLDAATLTIKNSFTVGSSQSLFSYPSMLISADNTSVYISGASNNQLLFVYNLTTGLQTGWLPEPQLEAQASYTPSVPLMQAISSNGLVGGVMEQGFGFIDVSTVNPMPVGTAFGVVPMLGPTYGPAAGSTDTSWWQSFISPAGGLSLGSVYFGANAATAVSASSTGNRTIYATSPAGPPGTVDIYTVTPDGGEQILPEGFSYGPSVLEAPTGYATEEGGGNAQVYGYGLGSSYIPNLSQQIVSPPLDLGITIGNTPANITGYLPGPFSALNYFSLPFPLVGAEFTIPSGVAGRTVNLNLSNSKGSTELKQALTYLPPIKTYPVDGHLLDGTYDSLRDVYYFTDANQIRVFSRSKGWLAPIPVLSISGAIGPERLLGIALSPDNSRLIVSDAGGIVIYVIDVSNPANIKGYALGSILFFQAITETPSGVAITNAGQIYFTTFDQNGDGSPYLIHIDPATGKADFPGVGDFSYLQTQGAYQYGRLPTTADGSRIYFNNAGQVGYIDTVTGKGIFASQTGNLGQVGYDVYLSPNQTSLYADGFLMDSQMAVRGFQALNYRESFDADYVYGATLSPDGTLLFQPGTGFIDVFDGRTGVFRTRISLSVTLSANYRALVGDKMDNVQVAITGATGSGIAVIDLNSLPEPNPLAYPEVAGPAHPGVSAPSATQFKAKPRAITPAVPTPARGIKHRITSPSAFTR